MGGRERERDSGRTPSLFICSEGMTSLTVRSTRTPPIIRKHFRVGSFFCVSRRVLRTRLVGTDGRRGREAEERVSHGETRSR